MRKIALNLKSCTSEIFCGEDSFKNNISQFENKHILAITDKTVFSLYGDLIKTYFKEEDVFVLPQGEKSKSLSNLTHILSFLTLRGATRQSFVFAIGGGVIGDIAGLAAALYMRGTHLVQVATTLLAQVDSSVGGKTAVDYNGIKNLIGTFYQPEMVIIDPLFLNTLPKKQIRCGLGEIVKYGALDSAIFNKLIKNSNKLFDINFLSQITYDCICHKANIVKKDEKDILGVRKTLNLGHTTGHAFELFYGLLTHGEFVLIGMYFEMYIARHFETIDNNYFEQLTTLIKKVIGRIPKLKYIRSAAQKSKFDKKNDTTKNISIIAPINCGTAKEILVDIDTYINLIEECNNTL